MAEKSRLGLRTLEFIDVFMEKGVFEAAESRQILEAGQKAGLSINFHGDELSAIQAAELGAELNATAISHLEHVRTHQHRREATASLASTSLQTCLFLCFVSSV